MCEAFSIFTGKNVFTMAKQTNDPGLGARYFKRTKRIINKDGTFNVKRYGTIDSIRDVYQSLISISWLKLLGIVIAVYVAINCLFALIYVAIGVDHLSGVEAGTFSEDFFNALFFSTQTFTTVGYGAMSPQGFWVNLIAMFESMMGLLSFALATGIIYGRFSKPSARIMFSEKALIVPGDQYNLHFRIINQRSNVMLEMDATVMLMITEQEPDGSIRRRYYDLPLELNHIKFFPLSWTIVHSINESSPLYGKTEEQLCTMDAEILILIKGFDETFSQVVYASHSYLYNEIVWGAKFVRPFKTNEEGDVEMHINDIHTYEKVDL